MCPWPRIQAALTDEYALQRHLSSRPRRAADVGEEGGRRPHARRAAGDCVDCHQCVAVCPTGVDIREGPNLGCIQCGLCIDACDTVMERLDRPTRLIAYDTDHQHPAAAGRQVGDRPHRPAAHLALFRSDPGGRRGDGVVAVGAVDQFGQRHPRPQSRICRPLRRRHPQRLHRPHPQQADDAARLRHCGRGTRRSDHRGDRGRRRRRRPRRRRRRRTRPAKCASSSASRRRRPRPRSRSPSSSRIREDGEAATVTDNFRGPGAAR